MCYFCLDSSNTFNAAVSAWMQMLREGAHATALTDFMLFVTYIGSPESMTAIAVAALLVLLVTKKYKHMIHFVLALSFCAFAIWAIKNSVQLPRPVQTGLLTAKGFSFISGHAAFASTFIILMLHIYLPHVHSRVSRWLCIGIGVLAALLIGVSRLYLGVHYVTDVLGGFILGSVVGLVSIYFYRRCSVSKRVR